MSILTTTISAQQALNSTSAVYFIVKATINHGAPAVISRMAQDAQKEQDLTIHDAFIHATVRHQEIMQLVDKGPTYKALSENLDAEAKRYNEPASIKPVPA